MSLIASPPKFRKPTYVVSAETRLLSDPAELWAYRDLFFQLTKRDLPGLRP
jgi:hypothetical protein